MQLQGNVQIRVFSGKCVDILKAIPCSGMCTEQSSKQSLCIKHECGCCCQPISGQVFSKKLLHLLLSSAALPDTSQPSCSLPRSESSRAVNVFVNFPALRQASSKDGCRKALQTTLLLSLLSTFFFKHFSALILFSRHLCQTKAYR